MHKLDVHVIAAVILFCIIFASTAVVNAQSDSGVRGPVIDVQKVPIIFVPGLKGSKLVDKSGRTVWVNGLNALGYSGQSLKLPLFWHPLGAATSTLNIEPKNQSLTSIFNQLNFARFTGVAITYGQASDEILPDGPLKSIRLIPWLFDEKVYGPFLDELEHWSRPIYTFAYDWRRDNNESAMLLKKFVLKIKNDLNVEQVDVVGHSMGGLLVFSLMNQDSHLFRKVVFAGTPFHGGVGFMPDLHIGTATGFNKKILSRDVLFSFPSVYTLFPDGATAKGGVADSCALDAQGNPLMIDYFKVSDWRDFKLGLFANRRVSPVEEAFLSHALDQARIFRASLNVRNQNYVRSLVILGHKFKTLSHMIRGGPKSTLGWDFTSHSQVPGDGRVGANNLPPEYLSYDLFYSTAEHGQLLNDVKVLEQIKNYLMQ